jgi:hypothetical protein
MFADRQLRVRVLEALEIRVKQFVRREELWPLRVPREPLLLDVIIRQTLADDAGRFNPDTLRARTLLSFEWADGSWWRAWAGALPSGLKIYCDSGEHESRVLASGGRNEGDESDRAFLELFGESAGRHFGIEMSGGAPRSVRSPFPRDLLIEMFVNLFEVTGAEDSVRGQLADVGAARGTPAPAGHDFRADVEEWLDAALRRRSLISSPAP